MLATFQLGEVLLSIMWFFLFFIWIMLLFQVIVDIFRDHSMGGWGKAGWLIFILFLPYLGVLVYLIAHGGSMARRDVAEAQANEAAFQDYVRQAAGSTSTADELSKLGDLRSQGVITDAEFEAQKAKLLA